jgi:hypothetical protein
VVTLGLAFCALALFYVFFLPKPPPPGALPAMPLSTESGSNGYQAAWRWLRAQRIPVLALRERYDRLNSTDAPFAPTGNVLLTTLPYKLPPRAGESTQLDLWVERGNTLLVMAALDDTPLWTLGDSRLLETLGRMTRLKFKVIDDEPSTKAPGAAANGAAANGVPGKGEAGKGDAGLRARISQRYRNAALNAFLESSKSTIEPRGAHPLLADVHSVHVVSELPAARWRASPMDRSAVLQIGQIAGNGDPAIWLRRQGNGQVITFAVASIFSNQLIGAADNARLLSNLVAWSLRSGGTFIFDDAHQGSVSYYDAKAFFADSRLHRSLGWIVFLWFVFVLGVQRLRARPRDWNPVDITAFVAMSGDFCASLLPPPAVGARLFENFFNSIRRRLHRAENGAPMWEWLSAQAGVSIGELAELRRLHARLHAGRRIDLVRLQTILSRMQGHLA